MFVCLSPPYLVECNHKVHQKPFKAVSAILGDTHTCAIASRTWIWKTMHACMGQINSIAQVLANCEIAQLHAANH